jgi:hypothetical protein
MRPFQGRGWLAPFPGGVAPGYYIVPLRGKTSGRVRPYDERYLWS